MRFDLASTLLVITIAQVIFLVVSFAAIESRNRPARLILVLILLLLVWYQLEFHSIRNPWEVGLNIFYGTRYGSWLALGPLLYLYTRSSILADFQFTKRDALNFLPFILFWLVIPLFHEELVTNRAVHYGMLTVFDSWNSDPITPFQYVYGAIALGQFFYVAGYSWMSLRLISQTQEGLKEEYTHIDIATLQWQRVFHWVAIGAVLIVGAYVIYQFQTKAYRRPTDYLFVIPISVSIYLLTYQALRYPQLFFKSQLPKSESDHRYKKSSLSPAIAEEYLAKLKKALEEEELYTQRELRLNDLAEHLDVSVHHLSQVINESLQQNFFDLINQYRVEAAKQRITDQSDKSLLQIAFEVGFNNKTSFNNAFKRHVGMTPSQFKKSA